MIGFYKLLIFLIILIHKTNERCFPQYEYITVVTGKLTCKYSVRGGAVITLYTKSIKRSRRMVLTSKYVQYGKLFYISGTMTRFVTPRVHLKIYHTCTESKNPYIVKYVNEINWYYVTRSGESRRSLNLGVIELSKQMGKIIQYPKHESKKILTKNS